VQGKHGIVLIADSEDFALPSLKESQEKVSTNQFNLRENEIAQHIN